ncbi:hypothetical protein DRN38_00075 [Thermococci archaeon]|nr:MAG: hypothetical protein DRN38_00075 [Thermococci archaeon]
MPTLARLLYLTTPIKTSILITEQSGSDLTDYEVRIMLDSGWDGWDKVSPDGNDIFVTDENGKPLYYWIEKIDKDNKSGVIWCKVPSIPANGQVKIYLYYGGINPYVNYRDGSKVFKFFDDIETWTGWEKVGDGDVTQTTEQVYHGAYSLKKISNCDPHGGRKSLGFTLDRNYWIVEFFRRRNSGEGTDCYADRTGVEDANGNGYSAGFSHGSSPSIYVDKRSGGSATQLGSTSVSDILSEWYIAQLILTPSVVKTRILKKDYTLHAETTVSDTTYTSFTHIYIRGGRPYYVDVIRIRKYVDPEPSVQVLSSINVIKELDFM